MSGLAAKVAKKAVESELKSQTKCLNAELESRAKGQRSGPRRRAGDGVGDKVEGCCNRCCGALCRTSPWQQLLCWACVALTITTVVVWLGGAFLVGPAKNNTAKNQCGASINIPVLNKDGYVFYLGTSGAFVIVMIVASCLCCCSGGCLCTSALPRGCRICGAVGVVLGSVATAVFVGWVVLGTYLVLKIRGADTICRNTVAYLALMYLYLVVLLIVGMVGIAVWQCKDRNNGRQSANTATLKKSSEYKKLDDNS